MVKRFEDCEGCWEDEDDRLERRMATSMASFMLVGTGSSDEERRRTTCAEGERRGSEVEVWSTRSWLVYSRKSSKASGEGFEGVEKDDEVGKLGMVSERLLGVAILAVRAWSCNRM
jgi:hypothetical protein